MTKKQYTTSVLEGSWFSLSTQTFTAGFENMCEELQEACICTCVSNKQQYHVISLKAHYETGFYQQHSCILFYFVTLWRPLPPFQRQKEFLGPYFPLRTAYGNKLIWRQFTQKGNRYLTYLLSVLFGLFGWFVSRITKKHWIDFHETRMEEGSRSRIDPVNFWCRWVQELFLFPHFL